MRIPIREQLGLLVLLTSLIALAVIAIATVCILRTDRYPGRETLIFTIVDHQLPLCNRRQVSPVNADASSARKLTLVHYADNRTSL